MSLINCPECQNQVSDQALACPKCGHPVTQAVAAKDSQADRGSIAEFTERITGILRDQEAKEPLEIRVGRLLKTRVRIDSELVVIGRRSQRCDSIYAIGWWSQTTKNLEWAQNEWTTGWVWLKGIDGTMRLTVPGTRDYQLITNKIWQSVGLRLLNDMLGQLDNGEEINLCGLTIDNVGLTRTKLGVKRQRLFWEDITHGIWDGKIAIWSQDKRSWASISLRHNDNAPVLVALLRLGQERIGTGTGWRESLVLS